MTADIEAPVLLPMTTFLIANDVPREHRTAACAAFALWLEQFGEGNAPLALLHLAEALKREQDRSEELAAEVERLRARAPKEAWFGAWECGCSDTEESPLGIPEFCPQHGRRLISNMAGQTKVQLNHSGVSGYGFHPGPSGGVV